MLCYADIETAVIIAATPLKNNKVTFIPFFGNFIVTTLLRQVLYVLVNGQAKGFDSGVEESCRRRRRQHKGGIVVLA